MKVSSLFQTERRDEALERLVIGISEAARNCTTVIKKINSLCQKPEDYHNPSVLIHKWANHLFTNQLHDFIEEWISPNTISFENEENLTNEFFCYLTSLTPFFYENKFIKPPNLVSQKKYKWTEDDYKQLIIKLLHNWFYSNWDNWDFETRFKNDYSLELSTKKVTDAIAVSSKAMSKLWNKQKKIDEIISAYHLRSFIRQIMPNYKHQFQTDLFLKYTENFIDIIPSAYKQFDDNFYEVGTYFYKYFKWSKYL